MHTQTNAFGPNKHVNLLQEQAILHALSMLCLLLSHLLSLSLSISLISCVRYAHENGCPWDSVTCDEAACYGMLEGLKYIIILFSPFPLPPSLPLPPHPLHLFHLRFTLMLGMHTRMGVHGLKIQHTMLHQMNNTSV
jgi:hypothetical protein